MSFGVEMRNKKYEPLAAGGATAKFPLEKL
jgi:hypothetical protein